MPCIGARGQLYSLDFLISMGLFLLAIGIVLGMHENATYQARESREKAELSAIAITATENITGKLKCPVDTLSTFTDNNYSVYGCISNTPYSINAPDMNKPRLMVPSDFNCEVTINGLLFTHIDTGCRDQIGPNVTDVASVERQVIWPVSVVFLKNTYEKCIVGPCTAYREGKLVVRVWKA